MTPAPDFNNYKMTNRETFILKSEKYSKKFIIEYTKRYRNNLVMKFSGIDTIEQAYRLVGYSVYGKNQIERDNKKSNLVEFVVKDVKGDLWGIIKSIKTENQNVLLEIHDESEVILVPFNKALIKQIDRNRKIVVIDPPEGLRNLNKI